MALIAAEVIKVPFVDPLRKLIVVDANVVESELNIGSNVVPILDTNVVVGIKLPVIVPANVKLIPVPVNAIVPADVVVTPVFPIVIPVALVSPISKALPVIVSNLDPNLLVTYALL